MLAGIRARRHCWAQGTAGPRCHWLEDGAVCVRRHPKRTHQEVVEVPADVTAAHRGPGGELGVGHECSSVMHHWEWAGSPAER